MTGRTLAALLIFALVTALLVGCSRDTDPAPPRLAVERAAPAFTPAGEGHATTPTAAAPTEAGSAALLSRPEPRRQEASRYQGAATSVEDTRAAAAAVPAKPRAAPQDGVAQVVWRGSGARRSVALTFDAGADRGYAESILDVLRDAGVRASFGMTGVWAEQNPDLVRRMAHEGHRLLNHSYDHRSFTGLSTRTRALTTEQRYWQLDRTEAIIVELTGQSTLPLFRSPYGDTDHSVLRDIAARGYAYNVLWTVDSRGWLGYSAGAIIQRCLALAEPGAIYIFHVGAAAQDGPALPAIISGLRAAGYAFETVDEILE